LPEEKIDEIAMHFNILDIIKTCRNAVKNMEIEDSEMAKLLKKLDDKEWEEHHNFCAPPQKQGHLLFVKEINELTQIQKLLTKNTAMKKTWEKWYEAAIAHDVLINEGKSHDDPEVLKFGETAEKLEKRMCKILKKMEGIVKGDN
ncbi:MAG: hypothetical protein JXA43_03305, partial [Candidatus Diapherotrites archaeon]|nr:hypothetical protein [Candidatus Diapherotrites archaeon]